MTGKTCICRPDCVVVIIGDSLYARGHNPASKGTKARGLKISHSLKQGYAAGRRGTFTGRKHSEESLEKIRQTQQNRSPEHKAKIKVAAQLRVLDPAYLEQLRESGLKGNKIRSEKYAGVPRSIATKLKISKTRRKRLKNGQITVWNDGVEGAQVAWNKDLTKETDPRVAEYAKTLEGHAVAQKTKNKIGKKSKIRMGDEKYAKAVAAKREAGYKVTGHPRKGKPAPWALGPKTANNSRYKHVRYNGTWMRSTWEVAYARYCHRNKIKYSYEPQTFRLTMGDRREGTYTPDFYHPVENVWIDVKGYVREGGLDKIELFREKYPELTLKILYKEDLHALGIMVR